MVEAGRNKNKNKERRIQWRLEVVSNYCQMSLMHAGTPHTSGGLTYQGTKRSSSRGPNDQQVVWACRHNVR
jgi:hypothetical protein